MQRSWSVEIGAPSTVVWKPRFPAGDALERQISLVMAHRFRSFFGGGVENFRVGLKGSWGSES